MVNCGSDSPPNSNTRGWMVPKFCQCYERVSVSVGHVMVPPDWSHNSMECMTQGVRGLIIRMAVQSGAVGWCQLKL